MWWTELAVVVAMIGINGILAGYEIALASVPLPRLQTLVREGRVGARGALVMRQRMEASLAAVQLGITLAGSVAAATGGVAAAEWLPPRLESALGLAPWTAHTVTIACVVVPLTVVTIIFGELIPKVFALRNAEWLCLKLSTAMKWFTWSVWPAVWLFESTVRGVMTWGERWWRPALRHERASELQELRATAALARASRLIGHREEAIILGASALASRCVREIMLPAEHISSLHVTASLAQSLVTAHLDMHTRFPVTEQLNDPQSIVGYVNVKDVVALLRLQPTAPTLQSIVRTIPSLDEELSLAESLERLMRERTHIALVRNAAGRVLGMITLEDIMEELVGDIQDEYDRLPIHVTASGTGWISGGGVSLARFAETTGIDLRYEPPASGARTLSDWVVGHLGHAVAGGETLQRSGIRVVVRKVRRQKVLEALVTKSETAA